MELIEREQQLKKFAAAWSQVRAGNGCIVLVSGEAGIGKTSLIRHFASGQGKTARVLWGACDDLFSPQPLGPFADIAIQTQSNLLQQIQSGADRLSISAEFLMFLQKSPAPLIMILEDLHWADDATLDVVKFLARRIQLTKTLLVISYRDDEVNTHHPLYSLLGDFPPHLTTRIPVPRFSENGVELLAKRAGKKSDDLYAVTGGNPFFVSEIIAAESERVPSSVRDAVLARVARLSTAARNIVELASLIPGTAELWLIEEILHPDPTALDECEVRGILHSEGDALAFRHELARRSVEESIPVGRIRNLHAKILEALLSEKAGQVAPARLVHHAARAGDEESTLRYAPAAARQASALGAHREAASLYKTTLSFARHLPLEVQAELFEGLSFENYLTDNLEDAIRAREQATLIWEGLGSYVRAGDCKRWLSRLYWSLGHKKEADQYADQAIDILMKQPPGPELAMAFSNKSQLHVLAWEEDPALEWGHRAMELAEELGAIEIYVHALTNVGSIETLKDWEGGHSKVRQALQIAREHELHDHVARCYANLASSYARCRQYPEAGHWMEEGLEYTTARDLDYYSVYLLGWQAQMFFDTGRWSEAEELAGKALRLSRGLTVTPLPALIALGHLKVRRGDPDTWELLDRTLPLVLPTGELQRIGPLAAARAEAAWWMNDTDRTIAEASRGYELALHRNDPWVFSPLAYWMWRAGQVDIPIDRLAPPYALMIRGEWQRAAQEWERIGCPFERALAFTEGDAPAKLEALAIFEKLGAKPAANEMRRKLESHGVKIIPQLAKIARQNDLSDLTRRELEILRWISEGLSNPAIAEKLTISVGTVKAHTANIYSKLGANNRVQAITRARELRLL